MITSIIDDCFPFLGISWFPSYVPFSQMFSGMLNFSVFWSHADVCVKPVHYTYAESLFLLVSRHLSVLICFFSRMSVCQHVIIMQNHYSYECLYAHLLKMVSAKSFSLPLSLPPSRSSLLSIHVCCNLVRITRSKCCKPVIWSA